MVSATNTLPSPASSVVDDSAPTSPSGDDTSSSSARSSTLDDGIPSPSADSGTDSPPAFYPNEPRCTRCGAGRDLLSRFITKRSNRNGNADRPYLKCMPCNKFTTFDDDRGIHAVNIECYCGRPSRLQPAGRNKGRGLHYVCSPGACNFYSEAHDESGDQITLTEDLVGKLSHLRII